MTELEAAGYAPLLLAAFRGPAEGLRQRIGHWAVTVATGAPWSHVELVIDGVCYSARVEGGVGPRHIGLDEAHWDVLPLSPRFQTPAVRGAALEWFAAHEGAPYDWLGIARFVLPGVRADGNICTAVVARAIGFGGRDPLDLDPGELVDCVCDMEDIA